jgi:hypothetical protein
MRLSRYLTEAVKPQSMKAVKITMNGWNEFLSMMEKAIEGKKPVGRAALESFLTTAYSPWNIEFEKTSKGQEKEQIEGFSKHKYVLGGQLDKKGKIYLQIVPQTANIMYSIAIRDGIHALTQTPLFDEIRNILSHELVHREQWKKAGDKFFPPEGKFNFYQYFADPQEIAAFAQQAAGDKWLRKDSDIKDLYTQTYGTKNKVYKKFMRIYKETLDNIKRGKVDPESL